MYKVQRDTQEKHALITQNFLLWALNMQILCGSFGYREGGKRNCPCPQWSCRRLCSPQVAVGIEVLSLRRTGRESSHGTSLPWASPALHRVWGFGFMISTLWKNCNFMLYFWFLEAIGQEGQSLSDAEHSSLVVPKPQLQSCVTKQDSLAPADSPKCHIAVGDE